MSLQEVINDPYNKAMAMSVSKLVELLNQLTQSYYSTSQSLVSDATYDLLRGVLASRDPKNKFLQQVGVPISKDMVPLPYPMGSLEKIKPETDALEKWIKLYKGPYVLSDKLDGIAGLLHKHNGKFKLYTRGDTNSGQDVTHLLPYILTKYDPHKLPEGCAIRGEIIMSKDNFEKVKDKYKNARNTISGLVNAKHFSTIVANLTEFIGHGIINPPHLPSTQMKLLEEWGFPCVNYIESSSISNETLSDMLQVRRKDSKYDIDGIVVTDSSSIYQNVPDIPEHSFSFKMVLTDQIAESIVQYVKWTVSKHGYIKPVVVINPVNVSGVTITNITANNAKYVVDNVLGPGSIIKLVRSGDVIPKIMEVITVSSNGKPQLPDMNYEWNNTHVDIIVTNVDDQTKKDMIVKKLASFFDVMNVKYLSEGIITKLVDHGYDNVFNIINADVDELSKIDGLGLTILKKVYENIRVSFEIATLPQLMAASGIFGRGAGVRKLSAITNAYPNILELSTTGLKDKIVKLDGFSDASAKKFVASLPEFKDFFNKLESLKTISVGQLKIVQDKKEGKFSGKEVVFTGPRNKELEDYIKKEGGTVSESVKKTTHMLLYDSDAQKTTSKYVKAKKMGILMMTHKEFTEKFM